MAKNVKYFIIAFVTIGIFVLFNLPTKTYLNETKVMKNDEKSIKKTDVKINDNSIDEKSVLCIIMTSEKTFIERSITGKKKRYK